MPRKAWDKITYPFHNYNGYAIKFGNSIFIHTL